MGNNDRKLDSNLQPLRAARASPAGASLAAVVGRLAGERVAESINPTRAPYGGDGITGCDYAAAGLRLHKCGPAYGFGVDARRRYPGRDFDDVESEMSSDWTASRGASILNWGWAKHAARAAWDRISRSNSLCA